MDKALIGTQDSPDAKQNRTDPVANRRRLVRLETDLKICVRSLRGFGGSLTPGSIREFLPSCRNYSQEDSTMTRYAAFGFLAALGMLVISCAGGGNAKASGGSSLARLSGSYAGIFSGQINTGSGFLPILGTGVFVSDGHGHLSGHETYTVDTTPCEAKISGTYAINPDGSGTDSITFTTSTPGCSSGAYTQGLAIAQRGKLVLLSNTNGDQINEEWHLQR
jgi:hypothetical protein